MAMKIGIEKLKSGIEIGRKMTEKIIKQYLVHHEKGGFIHVFAENEDKAIDAYFDSIKSMIGHQMKICSCYGDKPLDRSKVIQPVKVEEV